jgi:hypothetical protein
MAHLTNEQMDRIVAIDAYQRRRVDTRKLAAIAYEVHQNSVFIPGYDRARQCLDCINPLSIFYRPKGPNALTGPERPPMNAHEKMERAAEKTYEAYDNSISRYREIGADILFYGSLAAGTALVPEAGAIAAVAKILYPAAKALAKEEAARINNRTPNLEAEFTTRWVAWAYAQVRDGTEEGKVLEKYLPNLSDNDAKAESSTKTPVRAALAQLEAAEAGKLAGTVLEKLAKESKVQNEILGAMEQIKQDINDRKAAAREAAARAEKVRSIENVEGTFQMASYVLDIAGDSKGARIAAGLADSAGKVANLVQNAASMAPMMIASGYVGVAIALYSMFATQNDPGPPYGEMFKMLQQIMEQIERLRTEILDTLGKLDARLGNLLEKNIALSEAMLVDEQLVLERINELQKSLREVVRHIDRWGTLTIRVLLDQEDTSCIRYSGSRELLAPTDFIACRTRYAQRASELARDPAYAEPYEGLRTYPTR